MSDVFVKHFEDISIIAASLLLDYRCGEISFDAVAPAASTPLPDCTTTGILHLQCSRNAPRSSTALDIVMNSDYTLWAP